MHWQVNTANIKVCFTSSLPSSYFFPTDGVWVRVQYPFLRNPLTFYCMFIESYRINVVRQAKLLLYIPLTNLSSISRSCLRSETWDTMKLARPVQFSKFLLALASTALIRYEYRRNPWPNLCSFQDRLCVLKLCLLFHKRSLSLWVGATFVTP
jgi:hypothetical protein